MIEVTNLSGQQVTTAREPQPDGTTLEHIVIGGAIPVPSAPIGARDRLLLDLRRAGFTVTADRYAKALASPVPDIFTYTITDPSAAGAPLVTRMIVEVAMGGDIRIYLQHDSKRCADLVNHLYDIATKANAEVAP